MIKDIRAGIIGQGELPGGCGNQTRSSGRDGISSGGWGRDILKSGAVSGFKAPSPPVENLESFWKESLNTKPRNLNSLQHSENY